MRIEVLFNQDAKALDALRGQLEKSLNPLFPNLSLRIAKSSSSLVQITGTKREEDKKKAMAIVQKAWEDDSWLPD